MNIALALCARELEGKGALERRLGPVKVTLIGGDVTVVGPNVAKSEKTAK